MAIREIESKRLLPGRKYTVLVRSAARKAFFSAPLMFNVAFPKPKKVRVRRERNALTVTWDFPSEYSATHFLVTVESIYDQLRAVQVELHTCTFKMDAKALSENLDVMVYAISEDDTRSAPGTVTFISHSPNESTKTMRPEMETRTGTQHLHRPRNVSSLDTSERSDRAEQCDTRFMEDTRGDEPDDLVDYSNKSTITREPSGSVQVC